MTSKTLSLVAILLAIYSCAGKTSEERKIKGIIEKGQFVNDYMKMEIIKGWTELPTTDESQFLIIHKIKENFQPNIIFLALDKEQYKNMYGYQTVEQYAKSLMEHNKSKSDYKLLSAPVKVSIDKHVFYASKFLLLNGDKEYLQSFYLADINNYYLGLVATEENNNPEPEIETIIKSIKFKW